MFSLINVYDLNETVRNPSVFFVTYPFSLEVGEQNIYDVCEADCSLPPSHMLKHNENII
jgi:hypothetical protein